MKHVKLFEEYHSTTNVQVDDSSLNEGLKEWAVAGALTLSTIMNTFGAKPADNKKEYAWHKQVGTEEKMQDLVKNHGWTLDSTAIKKIITTYDETKPGEAVSYDLKFDSGFELGGTELKEQTKKTIDSLFDSLEKNGLIVAKISIESSTDKVPITIGGSLYEAGIKTNKDLSAKRTQAIVDYLLSSDSVTASNAGKIFKTIKYDQGRDIDTTNASDLKSGDASARYVKISVEALSPSNDLIETVKNEVTKEVHYLSKPFKSIGGGNGGGSNIHVSHTKCKTHKGAIECPRP